MGSGQERQGQRVQQKKAPVVDEVEVGKLKMRELRESKVKLKESKSTWVKKRQMNREPKDRHGHESQV